MPNDKDYIQMIEDLSNAFGAPGFEEEVVEVAKEYAKDSCEWTERDPLNNLYLYRKGNTGEKPILMLDAHSDETAFMIQAIRENGTLDFLPLGGWVPSNIPSSKVWIRNHKGDLISGIFASKPPHFMSAKEKQEPTLDVSQMVIDVGATSSQEVREVFEIEVGDPAVPAVTTELNPLNNVFLGKAFDCRIGCAVVLETLKRLAGEELSVDVIGTLTSQEEVGERGCMAAVKYVRPTMALVMEGAPADDTFMPAYKIQNGLHRGTMLRHMDTSMIANPRLVRFVIDTAKDKDLPLQRAVRSGGGTNGGVIHTALGQVMGGIPAVVLSCPVRYTHSHHTYTALDDFETTVELVCEVIRNLKEDVIATF